MVAMTVAAEPSFKDQALALVAQHIAWVEPIVFALGLAESLVLVSLFVPSTVLFLGIGALHSAAGGSFWPVWIAGSVGAFIGDIASYGAGRYYRAELPRTWPFSGNRRWYALARVLIRRWGMLGIVAAKFLGVVRPFVPVVAGALHMRLVLFLIASAASCLLWAGVFLAPGYGVALLMPAQAP